VKSRETSEGNGLGNLNTILTREIAQICRIGLGFIGKIIKMVGNGFVMDGGDV